MSGKKIGQKRRRRPLSTAQNQGQGNVSRQHSGELGGADVLKGCDSGEVLTRREKKKMTTGADLPIGEAEPVKPVADPVNAEEVAPKGARVVVVAAPKRGSQSATVNQRERADVVGVEHDADSALN